MENVVQNFYKLMKTTLVRHLGYYLFFCFFVWFFHLLIISFFTFIHLQLGHTLKVIDEWFFQYAWSMIIFSQLLSLFVSFHLVSMWSDRRQLLIPLLKQGRVSLRSNFLVVIAFLWTVFFIWGIPEFKLEVDVFKNFVSILGISLFYGFSVFYIGTLNEIFPLTRLEKDIQIILFPLLFMLMIGVTYPYRSFWGLQNCYILAFSLYLYYWRGENWTHPMTFLVTFVALSGALLGNDPVWESSFSFGKLKLPLKAYEWGILLFIAWLYLNIRHRGHWNFKNFKIAFANAKALREKIRGSR